MSGDLTPRREYSQAIVPRRRDESTGKYDEVYSEVEIINLLSDTRMATSEVADALGCHRTTAHTRLRELEEENEIESVEVGNTLIWELKE